MMVQGSMLLGVGTLLMLTGMMSMNMAGNLIIAKFIGALAIRPTMMIVMGWSQIIAVREALRDLRVFLDEIEETNESGIKLPPPTGSLAVARLHIKQNENSKKILDTVNFALKPGCVCAVLGESGAGKSTLGRLLVGFLKPSKGVIRLDGVAIDTWNKVQLCDHIGYLHRIFSYLLEMFGRILQGLKVLIRMSWSWCAKNLIFLRFTTPMLTNGPINLEMTC